MSETIENIKKFNIGDRVTSTHSILLDRGFRGVTGVIKTIVLDGRTWQYLIELDDGRELQCDDWHLEQPKLDGNQKIVLEWLKETSEKYAIKMNPIASIYTLHSNYVTNDTADIFDAYEELSDVEEAQVIQAFSTWVLEQEEDHNGIN